MMLKGRTRGAACAPWYQTNAVLPDEPLHDRLIVLMPCTKHIL